MKLKADITIPRPKGTWEIKRWNLLKGETEEDAETTVKNNFMTDACAIAGLMKNTTGVFKATGNRGMIQIGATSIYWELFAGQHKVLLLEGGLTPEESRALPDISYADTPKGGYNGNSVYFFPTGVAGASIGKEVKALGAYGSTHTTTGSVELSNLRPAYLLNLPTPIVLEEGDVIKVTFTAELPTEVTSEIISIPSTIYAFGEDPEDPNAGTSGSTFTGTLKLLSNYFEIQKPNSLLSTAQVKRNGDGSLEFVSPVKLISKTSIRPVISSPSDLAVLSFTNGCLLQFDVPNPQQLPGSYVECELELQIKIAPAS